MIILSVTLGIIFMFAIVGLMVWLCLRKVFQRRKSEIARGIPLFDDKKVVLIISPERS